MKKNVISMALILCATLQAGPIPDGSLDPSFGTGGVVTTALSSDDIANAVLFQPDGKIIAVGSAGTGTAVFGLARYNSNGSLDTLFGIGGIVTTDFVDDNDVANGAVLQPDGKIIAVGFSASNFALARYNSDGSLDNSFGTGGKVTTDLGGTDQANAAVLQPDGKIVAVGSTTSNFALARYNSDGSLDSSFGTGGIVTTDFGGTDSARAVLLQLDGKIIAVGQTDGDFGLARYNSNGSLDTSFGTDGKVTTDFAGGFDNARAAVLQPDGKIVAVGFTTSAFALARYNSNGSLDTSFGTGGKVTTDFTAGTDQAFATILQPDGKIIAAGRVQEGDLTIGLARYNSNGSLDTSFGIDGIVITDLGVRANAAILQSDGKIIAAGTGDSNFVLARYLVPSLEISQLAKDFRSKYFLLLNPNYSH